MRRREFIAGLGGSLLAGAARAQQNHPALIGVLQAGSQAATTIYYDAFREALAGLGHAEGRDVRFEYRFADGVIERLPTLAEEIVRLNPRVIVSAPVPASVALAKVTRTIPVVMATGADPVSFGLAASLSRPGGNFTGLANFADELASKQLDLLRELLPQLSRVGVLLNVANPLHVPQWRQIQDAAGQVKVSLIPFEYRVPEDLERAFAAFTREKADGALVPPDTTLANYRDRIVALAAAARLPTIYNNRLPIMIGGLISYGLNSTENYRRSAVYVDKILKGANPAEMPIEQPTKIELVINLKTPKAMGLTVPPQLLARADEVIE